MNQICMLPDGREIKCNNPREAMSVWREISEDGAYGAAVSGLSAGAVILDVGAHIGLAAIHFADLVPGARILSFEPAPKSFSCLKENLARHTLAAEAYPLAVGACAGEQEITYFPNLTTMATLYPDPDDDQQNLEALLINSQLTEAAKDGIRMGVKTLEHSTVEVTTVTDIVAENGIDGVGLLKVDAERAESAVLDGISEDVWPRIAQAVIEVHDLDGRLGHIRRRLEGRGFETKSHQDLRFVGGSVHIVLATRG
jgi:31-O-methyltransferase